MVKRIKRVQRSADTTPVGGNLLKIGTPAFISLVGKPANQRAFSVVRSANEVQAVVDDEPVNRIKRTRRSDNPVMMLTFPDDYDEDDVNSALTTYGMTGYNVSQTADGVYCAMRSDLQSIAGKAANKIRITSDGITAHIEAITATPTGPVELSKQAGIAVVRYEFTSGVFDPVKVEAWFKENNIDFTSLNVENPDGQLLLVNGPKKINPDGTEVKRMELAPGVVVVLCRDDAMDLPEAYSDKIAEEAYGSWGWGHMDFGASLADEDFCETMSESIESLENVLRNIIFYNALPLDVRKQLVSNALMQFGAFVNNAIDALPRQVLQIVARAANATQSEKDMTKKDQSAEVGSPVVAPAMPITREELLAIIREEMNTASPVVVQGIGGEATGAPGDPLAIKKPTDAVVVQTTTVVADPIVAQPLAVIPGAQSLATDGGGTPAPIHDNGTTDTVSRADMAALIAEGVALAIKPLQEQLTRAEATVVLRSGEGAETLKTPKKESVFRGSIFGTTKK